MEPTVGARKVSTSPADPLRQGFNTIKPHTLLQVPVPSAPIASRRIADSCVPCSDIAVTERPFKRRCAIRKCLLSETFGFVAAHHGRKSLAYVDARATPGLPTVNRIQSRDLETHDGG